MRLKNQLKIKEIIVFCGLLLIIFFTRLYNLSWGLPFPFHPDERNMAVQIVQFSCQSLKNCLRPEFFAYGQLPMYLAYFLKNIFVKFSQLPYKEHFYAFFSLRLISAFVSLATIVLAWKIISFWIKNRYYKLIFILVFSFVPSLMQFSRYGTTEALLSFFFTLLVYESLKYIFIKEHYFNPLFLGAVLGVAAGVKLSALLFFALPFFAYLLMFKEKPFSFFDLLFQFLLISIYASVFYFVSSPFNILDYRSFLHSINYELAVAQGKVKVFYTQQFEDSVPILFQLFKIFPYSLGLGLTLGFFFFFFSRANDKGKLFLKFAFLFYFLSQAFLYAKWVRFLAPIFPIMAIGAYLWFYEKRKKRFVFEAFVVVIIAQGLISLLPFLQDDIRFTASDWILANAKPGSLILQEAGNVVDLPVVKPGRYQFINKLRFASVDFFNSELGMLDLDRFNAQLKDFDYFIVPSRRVFANYTCFYPLEPDSVFKRIAQVLDRLSYFQERCKKLEERFPEHQRFYSELFFSGKYELLKSFSSFDIAGVSLFYDELAEETFSVFDHPVIRVYKRKD